MNKLLLLLGIVLTANSLSFGQGTVRGIIKDENGESVIGAAVVLKSNRSYGVTTDLDGSYALKISDSIPQTIIISLISYKTIEESVHPVNGEILIKNYFLVPATQAMKEVEITAKAVKAKEYYTELIKKKSATTIDYISSETMKKTGDNNVSTALARVSGISTNGSFLTVRGIGDRYVKTAINGLRIPTLDPYTNNIKLDIIPASLVDNIFITKTASPDIPGDWAGAYLSIETKDYPEQLAINVETTFGYNNQSTFKDVLTTQKSSTDWLGYDNGFRDQNHNDFVSANMSPTKYQEFVALGLGNYYNSIGVNENTPWNETYYKLGLVELKLLAPAQFEDANAVSIANGLYENGPYSSQAFSKINSAVPKSAQSLPNNWNTFYKKAPLNFSQSFSIGNQVKLFGKPLGFITGFRFGNSVAYDPNATANRQASPDGILITVPYAASEEASKQTNGWSALANLAYKFNPNNSVSFLFMPNIVGVNNVRYSTDYGEPNQLNFSKDQFYESRRQLVYQFKYENYIPGPKMKLEFNASYTDGNSEAPDFKRLQYVGDGVTSNYGIGQDVNRGYRYLSENIFDTRLSAELPIGESSGLVRKLKFGAAYQDNERKSEQYYYFMRYGPFSNSSLGNTGIDNFFSLDKFNIRSGVFNGLPYSTLDLYYIRANNPADHTIGYSRVKAGFAMFDYSINPLFRVQGGLRIEQADIFTDAYKYDSLHYATNDTRRQFGGELLTLHPGQLNELSFLPSLNIVYKLKNNDAAPVNLRLNFSQTVARPSIRELTDVVVYDYDLRTYIYGNSDLKNVQIDNYDVRIESYFESGDNISLSLFYKNFKNHIEISDAPQGYAWINVDKSRVAGVELEGKKVITKHLEFKANLTLVDSKTEFQQQTILITNGNKSYFPGGEISRTMYGQAPYVINGMLTYSFDKIGLTLTLNYNVQGPRLFISSPVKIFEVYEIPRHLLDANVTKTLGKYFSVNFKVRDILNSPVRRSYNREEGWVLDYDKYSFGTNFILGITYKI